MDEKEVLLRHAYGVGYPEPNVTFALCRGTWSSPAVSVLFKCIQIEEPVYKCDEKRN